MKLSRRKRARAFATILFVAMAIGTALAGAPRGGPVFISSPEFGTSATIPVAWRDYDADGDLDLAVGNYFNQANELYVNDGEAAFTRLTPFGGGLTFAVSWADYDNDGDADLAVGNNGQNWLYVNNGDGTFTQQNQFGTLRTVAVAWGDADLDGDLDIALGNGILGVAQQNYLYVNNGDGSFSGQAQFGMGQTDSIAWADYDNDGDLDLAVGNGGFSAPGQNYLFVNNGDGTFSEQAQFGLGDTAVVAWGDADNDGLLDLAVGNWTNGQNYLYRNNGDGTFDATPSFGARDTNTVAWADVDHDGDLDLAVGNGDFTTADQNYLYLNDGTGNFTEEAQLGLGSTDGIAWGDVDGDGDLDAAVGNEHTPPQNELWTNQLDDEAYLVLRLIGRSDLAGSGYSNRDAVGARVAVYAAGHLGEPEHLQGHRQVDATGGFASQNAPELTFGVTAAVDIEIFWPGSADIAIVQRVFGVEPGQQLSIIETTPGDVDADGFVDILDLLAVLAAWGPCEGCPEDFDGNSVVDVLDLLTVLANWS